MKLVFLGTSAAQPTENRGLSCICLEREGEILMFDAGEGAQVSYLKSGLGWNKKMKIFVTHMHGDHCIGVLGYLAHFCIKVDSNGFDPHGLGLQ
jgi:ribonuclease Z